MANVLQAYVLYSESTKHVISMSLMRRRKFPKIPGVIAVPVNSSLCCDGEIDPIIQGGTSKMKAFILYGSNGQALSGPIIRKNKPKASGWRQIRYDLCCDSISTTTTSTSTTSTTTSSTTTQA